MFLIPCQLSQTGGDGFPFMGIQRMTVAVRSILSGKRGVSSIPQPHRDTRSQAGYRLHLSATILFTETLPYGPTFGRHHPP
jgi:hypothetical protein